MHPRPDSLLLAMLQEAMGVLDAAVDNPDRCGERNPAYGFCCSLLAGHGGVHVACSQGKVVRNFDGKPVTWGWTCPS